MTKGEQTRERIFQVAVEEFAEHGYEGARVAHIAELANVNKERIYANFGNKEQLFEEVWKRTYDLIIAEDRGFLDIAEDRLPEMGRIILSTYMRFHDSHPEFWKIFAWENLMRGKHKAVVRGLKKPVHTHLERLYRIGQESGIFKKTVSFSTYMFVLIAISFTYASNKATMSETLGLDFSSPTIEESYLEECCHLVSCEPGQR
jgi:AcrR family transcriptional regulator